MARFAIATDGTCTLPESYYRDLDIDFVPLHVMFGMDTFTSGVDLTHDRFYELVGSRKEFPTTSQPSLGEWRDLIETEVGKGYRDILIITIDSALSGTYAMAKSAAQASSRANIVVVDSRTVSGALGLVVAACAKARRDGRSFQDTATLAERLAGTPQLFVYVDTLDFLKHSGRVPAVQALFGTLLQIKPILRFADGTIENVDKVRTRSRGIARVKELAVAALGEGARTRLCVLHTKAAEPAREVAEWARRTFHCTEFFCEEAGPVLATHVGPGVVAIGFVKEDVA